MSFTQEHLVGRPDIIHAEYGAYVDRLKKSGLQLMGRCPSHQDSTPSFSVNPNTGEHHCFGCGLEGDLPAFLARMRNTSVAEEITGLRKRHGLGSNGSGVARPTVHAVQRQEPAVVKVTSFEIRDARGEIVATHVRRDLADGSKQFAWERDGQSGLHGVPVTDLPLYGSERLAATTSDFTVIVTEGEKAADALLDRGFVAGGTVTGASGTPGPKVLEALRDRDVVLWPDNDEPGRRHMERVAASLQGIARGVGTLSWGEREGDDAADFFARGGTEEQLDQMLADAPEWRAAAIGPPNVPPSRIASGEAAAAQEPRQTLPWPDLPKEALYGLAGDIVAIIDPHTEAARAAILTHFLVFFGNCMGVSPFVRVCGDEHRANLFAVLVGKTSKGRKGTSEGQVRRLFEAVDETWPKQCIVHGLSSGEGLISALVPDPKNVTATDPRLTVIEPEFANVLRVMQRDGNTLSGVLRQAWDRGSLRVMTRKNPLRADGVHVSIVAHVTQSELLTTMDSGQTSNGFANRFLWIGVGRSKLLPEPTPLPDEAIERLRLRITNSLDAARRVAEMKRTAEASALWQSRYEALSAERTGLVGVVTSRAEAQVTRLSLIYALLDSAREIGAEHMKAALAFWDFSAACAARIFGGRLGNPIADRLLLELRETGSMARNEISEKVFGKNLASEKLEGALLLLEELGQATRDRVHGEKGRPAEVWHATRT